jgi:hypothetical protein
MSQILLQISLVRRPKTEQKGKTNLYKNLRYSPLAYMIASRRGVLPSVLEEPQEV